MYAARDGKPLITLGDKEDVGRGVSADIDPRSAGTENWGGIGGLRDCKGKTIFANAPRSFNFTIYWDADAQSELLDKNYIDKWNWAAGKCERLLQDTLCRSNNGTKAVPCFSGDILGDWREEVIWRTRDSKELRIYTTPIPATFRLNTLLSDRQYRLSLVWQNVAYNQPPHLSFDLQSRVFPVGK
jgi:rhamnogalacturonan endolyase